MGVIKNPGKYYREFKLTVVNPKYKDKVTLYILYLT